MLREIAADVLHFLTRRDLDKACAVNKWLDSLIAQCVAVYPLRAVRRIALCRRRDSTLNVLVGYSAIDQSFCTTDDAVHFAASLLRNSYVEHLELGNTVLRIDEVGNSITLFAHQWTTLLDAISSGAVRDLEFRGIDFSALDDDAFLIAVGSRGLQSLLVRKSIIPRGFIADALLRASAANGVLQLDFIGNTARTFG